MSWTPTDDRTYGYEEPETDEDLGSSTGSSGLMKRPSWLSNKILTIVIIVLFFLGLAFLIAGAIMLGIGVSKSQKNCPTVTASPYYATIESTAITYADVQKNYQQAVDTVTQQIREALGSPASNKMALLDAASSDPFITILGLSQSPKGRVMAVVGMAYTSADAPSLSTIETNLNSGQQMTLYHAGNTASQSSDQQMCSIVSIYQVLPNSTSLAPNTGFWTTTLPSDRITTTTGTTTTTGQCICPTTTVCPTPAACPTPVICPTSTSCPVCPTTGPPATSISTKSTSTASTITTNPPATKTTTTQPIPPATTTSTTTTATNETTRSAVTSSPTTSTVSSSTSKMSMTSTVSPSTSKMSMTSTVSPSTSKMSMTSTVSPSTSKMSMTSTVSPSTSKMSMTSTVSSSTSKMATTSTVVSTTAKGTTTPPGTSTVPLTTSTPPPISTSSQTSTTRSQTISTSPPTTTSTLPPTTSACIPVTTSSPRPGARDVVVLVDDSTAVRNAANYNQLTSWLGKQLFPQWPVSQDRWEAAPTQYALKEYNLLMDFDANSINELVISVTTSVYSGRNGPSVTKALKSTLGLAGRLGVHRVVLLLSASSNLTDLETALPLAEQIKAQGDDIITMALGGADGGVLGLLASGADWTFSVTSFTPSADQATAITDLIQGRSLTTPVATSSAPSSTSTSLPIDFPCHPDIAILVDTSEAVPTQAEYERQLTFISDQLAPSWSISPKGVETEIVIYSTFYHGFVGQNEFAYQNYHEFSDVVHQYDYFYNRVTPASINGTLNYYATTIDNRRSGRQPTTLLFAYSDDKTDIIAARSTLPSLGNLIIVGMGTSTTYLTLLTGNVITGMDYDTQMIQQINSLLCVPSTPAPLPTTQVQTTTTSTSSSATTTSTPTTAGTTITPQSCPDCVPDEANILLAMDSSSLMSGGKLDLLKSFINSELTFNWSHPERLALLGFDTRTRFSAPIDFGDLNTMDEFHKLVTVSPQLNDPPSLTSAFQHALNNYHLLAKFGQQKTVIFTISADPQDVFAASSYADSLSKRGIVVLVGMNMPNTSELQKLAPSVISWPDLSNSSGIADQINQALAGAFLNYTTLPPGTSTTVTGTRSTSTPLSTTASTSQATTTVFTASPAICSRDVVLLLDESNAFPDLASFNQVKTWLIKTLVPLWEVNPNHIAVAPYGFANKTFDDLGGNFLENSQSELEMLIDHNLRYLPTTGPNVHYGLSKVVGITTRPGAAVVLISASDTADDVNQGLDYARQLKQGGGTVITLSVGPNGSRQLEKLSSGPAFTFYSRDFVVSNEIAADISDVLCSSAPPVTTTPAGSTTKAPTTTTTTLPPPAFPCTLDVAFLFDNSGKNSNFSTFNETVSYVADQLLQNWLVDSNHTEVSIIMANSILPITDSTPWRYRNREELQDTLHQMAHDFFGGQPSIYNLLEGLQETAPSRRTFHPLTAIMFTFSSDQGDVARSLELANSLGANIVAVGLGSSDSNTLGLLTGNVVTGMALGDQLTAWINSVVCYPQPPLGTLSPTTSYVSTAPTTSTRPPTTTRGTTTTLPTTTVIPEGCPDCYPDMANLLILVDSSVDQSSSTFSNQKQVVLNLVASWTHMERVGLGSFASSLSQLISYDTLAPTDLHGLQIVAQNIQQTRNEADLGKSLHQATGIVPNPLYGEQRTILFTSTAVISDKASQAGQDLRGKGQLIVVGIGMSDVSGLSSLASPGDALPWGDVSDTTTVVQDIMGALRATTRRPAESTTPGTTTSAARVATTTLPANVISCQKDILLLIDDSNAYGGQDNFASTKNWIVNSLVPSWNINPTEIAPLAAGYANKSWNNIGGDFGDVGSVGELQTMINGQLYYLATRGPSLTYGLKNAVAASRLEMVTIIVSASEEPEDINMAYPYAVKLKEYGAAVITLFVGPSSQEYLGQLSSGSNYSFTSTDYAVSPILANSISARICGPEPIFTTAQPITTTVTTTPGITTPTTLPPPFSCNPDVAFLFDSSSVNSNDSVIAAVVNFVADSVVKNWAVSLQETEAAPVFATAGHSLYGRNYWDYEDRAELQEALHTMAGYGVFQGDPSVKALLNALNSITQHRRLAAPLSAVMFTFSTDYQDVVNSLAVEKKMGANIVAVGLGSSDQVVLGLLTGNVIIPTALNDDLASRINNAICNPKPPLSQVTTTTTVPTMGTTPSSTVTTTVTTTTIAPEGCPDCYPAMSNLLLLIDNSANQTATTFSDQKQAVLNLISTWNHFERFALASYADSLSSVINYNDNVTLTTLTKIIGALQQSSRPADLGRALHMATGVAPVGFYGQQQTILFTTTVDNSNKATGAAGTLEQEGQLITVGVAMADASQLRGLASPGSAIAWANVSDTTTVVQDIMTTLGATTRGPTESTSSGTSQTSTLASTVTTTTLPANVISCQKDILLLIDTSNSFGGQDNFALTKNWIVNSLVPNWNISPQQVAPIAFGFANKSWNNIGGDFGDVASVGEFQTMISGQLFYTADRGHALAYGLRNARAVSRPETVTIVISASEDPSDIGQSIQYATQLKEYGGAVITLSVGPAAKGFLGQLSSGTNYSFVSEDYAVSSAIAGHISAHICGPEPLFTTSESPSQASTNLPTTVLPPPFDCNPDVAFLFDSSAFNSNDSMIAAAVNFVADNVVKSWDVNLQATEAAIIYATTGHTLYGYNYWEYQTRTELQTEMHRLAAFGVFQGDPSVKALLNALNSITQHRRLAAPLSAVMFTFSTDYQDVVNSLAVEKKMGANIVAVGLGSSDQVVLGLLTGNVIIPTALNDDLASRINNAICNPKPPLSQVTTTTASTATTGVSTSTLSVTAVPTTTVTPERCPDCYPAMSNLLLLIDNSANQTADSFADQKQAALNLISTWNHFERFALASYADSLSPLIAYNDNFTLTALQTVIHALQQSSKAADLGRALHMATGVAPVGFYGQQQTILFTTTVDNSNKATGAAGTLEQEGQLITVGVAMADASQLRGLASPGSAIAWANVSDTTSVVDSIMEALNGTSVPTTRQSSSTVPNTPSSVTMRSTTTMAGSTTATITSSFSSQTTGGSTTASRPSSPATTTGTGATVPPTTTAGPICTNNLILLMDDSNAIPTKDNFNQLKNWIIYTFLQRLQSFVLVDPVSYDDKSYSDIMQGFLPGTVVGAPMNDMYLYQPNSGPNITKALQKASTIQGPDGFTSTLLISSSFGADDVASAGQFATKMKANGVFITLLVGGTGDGLLPLATGAGMSFSSSGFAPDDALLNSVLNAICPIQSSSAGPTTIASSGTTNSASTSHLSPSSSTASESTTATSLQTTTGGNTASSTTIATGPPTMTPAGTTTTMPSTTTTAPICTKDLILLMDDSNAIPTSDNFNQLKTWLLSTFLQKLQSFIQVDAISYDDKRYQDIAGGFLPGNVVGFPMNDMYTYQLTSGPNITKTLQKASTIQGPDGTTSTLLISASAGADDVASAGQFATKMKANGVFITLLVGGTGDGLLPLATGAGMSFSSSGFAPDDGILAAILDALCPVSTNGSTTAGGITSNTAASTGPTTTASGRATVTGSSSTTTGGSTTLPSQPTTTISSGSTSTVPENGRTTTASSENPKTTVPTAASTTPSTTSGPTTTVDLYIPTKEDIVIVFDTSSDVNLTTVTAQKQLILALTSNWTHFDRLGIVSAANADEPLASYRVLTSYDDVKALLQAVQQTNAFPDLAKALQFVNRVYPLEAGMTTRDVIFFTASTDTDEITRAQPSADAVKALGRLITVGIGLDDPSILAPLASTNSTISFTHFTDFSTTAAQINQLLM